VSFHALAEQGRNWQISGRSGQMKKRELS